MKKLMLMLITILSFAVFAQTAAAQDIPSSLSVDDAKTFRKIIADRDYEKARADEAVKQRDDWKASAGSWRDLYLAEKDRADRVQGGRVFELQKAVDACRDLNTLDKQRLAENEFTIRKLKSERKWYFAAGFGSGAAAGTYGAKKFNF